MSNSDAPQPPGGPLRQDSTDGDFAADEHRSGTDGPAGADGSDRERARPDATTADTVPHVAGDRSEQPDAEIQRQEVNAETATDQPSS